MKATTMAGMVAGGVMGLAVGAGLMMMPQTRPMRKAIEKSVCQMGKSLKIW